MKSSGQKTGYSIAVMIGVIIAAGIAVDWWDAHQSRKLGTPMVTVETNEAGMKKLIEEIDRLKIDNSLLNIENDALRKQVEEFTKKSVEEPKADVVQGDKPHGD